MWPWWPPRRPGMLRPAAAAGRNDAASTSSARSRGRPRTARPDPGRWNPPSSGGSPCALVIRLPASPQMISRESCGAGPGATLLCQSTTCPRSTSTASERRRTRPTHVGKLRTGTRSAQTRDKRHRSGCGAFRETRSGRPGRSSRGSRVAHRPEDRCAGAIDRAILCGSRPRSRQFRQRSRIAATSASGLRARSSTMSARDFVPPAYSVRATRCGSGTIRRRLPGQFSRPPG
jgi:hypothetical protein